MLQTGTCAGSSIIVRYTTTGGNFGSGNKFTAQLSNAFGQFTTPVSIGTSNFNLGVILATLPANVQFGFLYRIRVVSSNPAVTGSQSPNTVIVTSTAITATISTPNGTQICQGDSLTLQAFLPNATYKWSTGATSQSIKVGQPGSYWVKVTDPLGCDARDTVQITAKTGCITTSVPNVPQTNSGISFYPNPVQASAKITLTGVPAGFNKVQFIDMLGRVCGTLSISSNGQIQLPVFLTPESMYHIRLLKENAIKDVGKVLIQ